jgi:tetraacyldisaccharide 4'-kinase
LGLFELIYYLGYRLDRKRGLRRRRRLPASVISVGNITAGGTGKTSLAMSLAMRAGGASLWPAVLTRGYGGRLEGPLAVTPWMSEREAGDEALLMASKLFGVPVIKCADRYVGGLYALATIEPKPDIFILDDGFQHWRLYRDLDILVVSASRPYGSDRPKLLPIGRLREPLKELERADIIVASKCRAVPEELEREMRKYNVSAPVFPAWYEVASVCDLRTGERRPAQWISGREVFAFCGIGEPASFRQSLIEAGAVIKGFRAFRDHHRFGSRELGEIRRRAGSAWIVTTEKDIMRVAEAERDFPASALEVEMQLPDEFYGEVFRRAVSGEAS